MQLKPFIRDDDTYSRKSTTIKAAGYAQYTQYLLSKGMTPTQAEEFLEEHLPKEVPQVVRFNRVNCEDKHVERVSVDRYFADIQDNELASAPTLTTYLNKTQRPSFHSKLILKRLAWRTKVKQQAFDSETAGRVQAAEYESLLQVAIKTGNNSISGIYGIQSTAIGNKTAHSTLTSCTRVATNTANVTLERLLSGTIILHRVESASQYVLALLVEFTRKQDILEAALVAGNFTLPTVDQVYDYLYAMSRFYHRSHSHFQRLRTLLEQQSPTALAFILYAGNLWQIKELNPEYMRNLVLDLLAEAPIVEMETKAAIKIIKAAHDGVLNATHHFLLEELAGKGNNYYNMEHELVVHVASKCLHVYSILDQYRTSLYPLLIVDTMPPNIAYTKEMARWSIVGSDTDSNLITFMNWATWYTGHAFPIVENIKVVAAISIFSSMASDDALRQLSVNLGVPRDEINSIEMKSEITASSVALAKLTKTYYQFIMVKEKSVLPSPYLGIKGVHLKSSALPKAITTKATALMLRISSQLSKGEPLVFDDIIGEVINVEREIIQSIFKGDRTYLRMLNINTAEGYKEKSPLKNNAGWASFWEGVIEVTLPFKFVKIPTLLVNKTALKAWVVSLPADRRAIVAPWLKERNKDSLPTIYIPEDYVLGHGIPDWIKEIVDVHRIVSDVCNIFYIILMSIGYFKPKGLMVLEDRGEPNA